MDPDPTDDSLNFYWKTTAKLDPEMLCDFLSVVQTHSLDKDNYRHSVLSLKKVKYLVKGTKTLVSLLTELFMDPNKLCVLAVADPIPTFDESGTANGVSSRAFKVGGYKRAESKVVFGHIQNDERNKMVSCDCNIFQTQLTQRKRESGVHWCKHLCFILMRAGFLPGHAFYYQSGFTSNELDVILTALEVVKVDKRKTKLAEGEWTLQNGSNVNATCAASFSRAGCVTEKEARSRQPILPPKYPRVVVMGKRKPKGGVEYIEQKIQFCPVKKCVYCVLPKFFKVSRPPIDSTIVSQDDVDVTQQLRLRSGGLNFV